MNSLRDPVGWFAAGFTCLAYQWVYRPLCLGLGVEPISITTYGVVMVVIGIACMALFADRTGSRRS